MGYGISNMQYLNERILLVILYISGKLIIKNNKVAPILIDIYFSNVDMIYIK